MVDVRDRFLELPHGTTPAAVSTNKNLKMSSFKSRPISLTCILCKVLEHLVASNIAKHFTELDILYDLQHGFREEIL